MGSSGPSGPRRILRPRRAQGAADGLKRETKREAVGKVERSAQAQPDRCRSPPPLGHETERRAPHRRRSIGAAASCIGPCTRANPCTCGPGPPRTNFRRADKGIFPRWPQRTPLRPQSRLSRRLGKSRASRPPRRGIMPGYSLSSGDNSKTIMEYPTHIAAISRSRASLTRA